MLTHEHDVFDKDRTFLIDVESRTIKNQSKKQILVKTDHNSEIFTFEMPRYIEGHDMTLCNVNEVHYINLGANDDKGKVSKGLYQIEDLQVYTEDNEKVVFSWVIKGNATKYSGKLKFKIKFKCVNNNAEITYLWNTINNEEFSVGEDINNTDYVEEIYADVLAQWEQKFIEAGAIVVDEALDTESTNPVQNKVVAAAISQLSQDMANNGKGLTEAQINALDGMFKVCVFDDSKDYASAYESFKIAFGINDSSGDSSGSEETTTTYTITNNLANATSDNANTSIEEGSSYVANISASSGYVLSNVTVTMGGTDITSSAYSNGVISIASVSGDIIITVTTTQETTEPSEATLTSIEATYNGGDVLVGSELTDLASNLVVNATYSDGSTETVTGYELNGEIVEGTNTITVTYGEITTTFDVVGYIESVTPTSYSGHILASNPSGWSDDDNWIRASNGSVLGNLANGQTEGTAHGFVYRKPFSGTIWVRSICKTTNANINYSSYMIIADDEEAINNPSYETMQSLKNSMNTSIFTIGDVGSQHFLVKTDGTYEQIQTGYIDSSGYENGYGVVNIQKFEIPSGKVGYLTSTYITSNSNYRYIEGINAVFYEDVTDNPIATVNEVSE